MINRKKLVTKIPPVNTEISEEKKKDATWPTRICSRWLTLAFTFNFLVSMCLKLLSGWVGAGRTADAVERVWGGSGEHSPM